MDITVFPPFRLTVPAVDRVTAQGGSLRISRVGQHLAFDIAPPQAGDTVYGCEGLQLAVESDLAHQLRGAALDFDGALFQLQPALSATSRTSTSPSPAPQRSRPVRRQQPVHPQAQRAVPVPAPTRFHAA